MTLKTTVGTTGGLHTPVLSTCTLDTVSGCGEKRGVHLLVHGDVKRASVTGTTLGTTGPVPAVNAIGTQLRDPINSGLTRWRMAV